MLKEFFIKWYKEIGIARSISNRELFTFRMLPLFHSNERPFEEV